MANLSLSPTYRDPSNADPTFSYLASMILGETGNTEKALSFVNEAILAEPNNPYYYSWKAQIFGELYNQTMNGYDNRERAKEYVYQIRTCAQKAINLFIEKDDIEEQAYNLEILADSFLLEADRDLEKAKYFAQQSAALGNNSNEIHEILSFIRDNESTFQPYQGKSHPSTTSGGGCYIATAVYGSYDCPEVWTLRRYRDYRLAQSYIGRLFIKVYYAISPKMVRHFGKTKWFNCFWKQKLNKMVDNLRKKGYSSEKYYD